MELYNALKNQYCNAKNYFGNLFPKGYHVITSKACEITQILDPKSEAYNSVQRNAPWNIHGIEQPQSKNNEVKPLNEVLGNKQPGNLEEKKGKGPYFV